MKIQLASRIKAIATAVEKEVVVLENTVENVVVPFLVNTEKALLGQATPSTGNEAEDLFLEGVRIASGIAKLQGDTNAINAVAEAIANAISDVNAVKQVVAPKAQ